MGYQVIDPEDVDPLPDRPSTAREISDHYVRPGERPADGESDAGESGRGPEQIGMRVYDAAPGEQLPTRYHYHEQQEETFYVLDGTLHVETPEQEYVVEAGQAFVVDPGSPHRGFNPADANEPVRVLSIGAPSYAVMGRNDGRPFDPEADR